MNVKGEPSHDKNSDCTSLKRSSSYQTRWKAFQASRYLATVNCKQIGALVLSIKLVIISVDYADTDYTNNLMC